MRYCNKVLLLAVLLSIFPYAFSQQIVFVTEDLPPLQIAKDHQPPTGALVEVIQLIAETANIDASIQIYPWARSYELALSQPNTFIFSMLRSEEREKSFKWVGSLFTIKAYLASLKLRKDIVINNMTDAQNYSVGAIRHYLAESYLKRKGFIENKNLYISSKYPTLWTGLYSGRTDLVFTNSIVWRHAILNAGLDISQINLIHEVPDFASELYLAANSNTDQALFDKIKASFETIKADGRYDEIMTKWQLLSPQH